MSTLIPLRKSGTVLATPLKPLLAYLNQQKLALPGDYLRRALALIAQTRMEIEVSRQISAERYERRGTRRTYRNGYRKRYWQTQIGEVLLEIPKLRSSSYFPNFLNSSAFEQICLEFSLRHYEREASHEDTLHLLHAAGVDAEPHEVAVLQESLYDLREDSRALVDAKRVVLDWLPYETDAGRAYLAVALSGGQLLAWEATPYLSDSFWRQFIRRVEMMAHATVKPLGQTAPTLYRMPYTSSPQMALAA